jgi:hypothetical protein
MSMDLYVFVDHPLMLTVIEWQQAIDAAHFPVRLDERIDLRNASGFFPVTLDHKKTGFYFLNVPSSADIPGAQRQHSTAVYEFSFGSHFLEGASAYYVAAALVASFHGRAFDPQSGQWLASKELKTAAGEMAALGTSEPGIPD